MNPLSETIPILGLIAILCCAALVFVHLTALLFGHKHPTVSLGLKVFLLFTVVNLFDDSTLALLSLERYALDITKFNALLWWMSFASTLNVAVKRFLWKGLLYHGQSRHVPHLLQDIVSALIYAVAIMIVMHFVYKEPITAVLATSGAAAFLIGFSAQSTLGEIFSGLSLNVSHAFRVGDFLKINDIYGQVHDINWRSVSIHNPDTDSVYIFPNSVVATSVVLNYNAPTGRFRNTIPFVVEPSASPEFVIRIISEALKHTRHVFREPPPEFNITGFTDLGVEYRVRYYFDGNAAWWDSQKELCTTVWTTLRRHGIRLAIDRHKLLSGDELENSPWTTPTPPSAESVRAALGKSPIFASLTKRELELLTADAVQRDYTPPDCVYQKGDKGASLFVVAEGLVSFNNVDDNGKEVEVCQGGAGTVFGLPREPGESTRSQRVQALQYSKLFEFKGEESIQSVTENSEFRTRFNRALSGLEQAYQEEQKSSSSTEHHQTHHHHRAQLINLVRGHAGRSLNSGFLTALWHTVIPSPRKTRLLNAMMASNALVVMANGDIQEREHDHVLQTLTSADLLQQMDKDAIINRFEHYLALLREDPKNGVERSLKCVRRIKGETDFAHLIIAICHGIHGPGGAVDDHEHQMIVRIAEALDVSSDPKDVIEAINKAA
jgi:small-conductance mechanosensitive channel/tellurite resistance protein/CRP-like cAMP-binding protein